MQYGSAWRRSSMATLLFLVQALLKLVGRFFRLPSGKYHLRTFLQGGATVCDMHIQAFLVYEGTTRRGACHRLPRQRRAIFSGYQTQSAQSSPASQTHLVASVGYCAIWCTQAVTIPRHAAPSCVGISRLQPPPPPHERPPPQTHIRV